MPSPTTEICIVSPIPCASVGYKLSLQCAYPGANSGRFESLDDLSAKGVYTGLGRRRDATNTTAGNLRPAGLSSRRVLHRKLYKRCGPGRQALGSDVPIGGREWRMLQGRRSQKPRTFSMGTGSHTFTDLTLGNMVPSVHPKRRCLRLRLGPRGDPGYLALAYATVSRCRGWKSQLLVPAAVSAPTFGTTVTSGRATPAKPQSSVL